MTTLMQAAQARATAINDGTDVTAYTDARKALANRPCLMFAPPVLEFTGGAGGTLTAPAVRWRLIALSSFRAPAFEAMNELQDLIAAADQVLDVERAEPIQFPIADGSIAAYLITTTDYPID